MRFGVGTGISRLTADAGSESTPFYLLEEIPQMQDFVLNFPISLPGEFWGDEQGEQRGEKL